MNSWTIRSAGRSSRALLLFLMAFLCAAPLVSSGVYNVSSQCKRRPQLISTREGARCSLAPIGNGNGATRDELALLSLIASFGAPNRPLDAVERERIDVSAGVLESTFSSIGGIEYPRDLALLDGFWTLLYTTASWNIPSKAQRVQQFYDTPERRVENSFSFGKTGPTVVIGGKFDVFNSDTLELELVDIQVKINSPISGNLRNFSPRIPLPSGNSRNNPAVQILKGIRKVFGFEPARQMSTDIQTTFLGSRIRVTRSSGGEMRIFCRPE